MNISTSQQGVFPRVLRLSFLMLFTVAASIVASAQTGGEGAIQGTVTDPSGAIVLGAAVTATNVATAATKTQPTSSAGVYYIGPLSPGTYTVSVSAAGFTSYFQENVVLNAMQIVGLNIALKIGSTSETVRVTAAPPALDTANAVLGATMATSSYEDLPVMLSVGGAAGLQQRDITQISNLMPGAQVPPGGRSSIIGGTAQRLGELYVDGLPITTASAQGDNRPVFNIIPLEGIDQVQVVTSGYTAEYQGAGLENYNLASGGNKYHGALFEYNRNTVFDAWSFASKPGSPSNVVKTVANGVVTSAPGPKTAERQNEYGFKIGGPISVPRLFNGHDKLFFFAAYDKFASFSGVNPSSTSVPTTLMRTGDFTELLVANGGPGYNIYDPTTLNCPTPTTCARQQFKGLKNGVPTPNVIPTGEISPITQYMLQWLPQPQVAGIQNNWLGGIPSGYNNWLYSGRIDWDISASNRLSMVVAGGQRHAVPYTATTNILPVPYLNDTGSIVAGHWSDLQDTYTITPQIVNQFKFGFMNFGGPPVINLTASNPIYAGASAGITGLPTGQASTNFPISTFNGNSNNPVQWSGGTAGTSVSETYSIVDNLLWVKNKHALTIGIQYQRLEVQGDTFDGFSSPVTLAWNSDQTSNINGTSYSSGSAANTGYSFASYMIGAVNSSGLTVQPFSVVGGRYHPISPYIQDDYKVSSKVTVNVGLRWDYIPTYNEAVDRWSFLNPSIPNPITGNQGALQFAGNYGGSGVSCNCRTPVNNYYKNFGPRLGFAFSADSKTVFRGGFGVLYSHAGGTGGAGGSFNGTGSSGFNSQATFSEPSAGPTAGPAFWLNSQSASAFASAAATGGNTYTGGYTANTNMGGPGYSLPAIAPPGPLSQGLLTGFFACSAASASYSQCNGIAAGGFAGTGSAISYPDPYLSGRAPEFEFWNFGMERELLPDLTH
jgi:Carboxypeptidase regulatory-like domain/TonB-dependent Receptor Plug Domain